MSTIKRMMAFAAVLVLPMTLGVALLSTPAQAAKCGNIETAFSFPCPSNTDPKSGDLNRNPIFSVLLFIINLMSIGVGVAVVGFIIWGSIMYITAGGSADQVKKAIDTIKNAIIGLVLYLLMFAAANYLIPGGVFN